MVEVLAEVLIQLVLGAVLNVTAVELSTEIEKQEAIKIERQIELEERGG